MAIVPIIIPFYKEHEKLRKCQAAIAAQTEAGCETFVRDNTHDNILYTAAVNEGLAKYCHRDDVRYVLVLNQDAYMDPDCVRNLVRFMDAHPDCGIACPLQYQEIGGRKQVSWGGSLQAFPAGSHRMDALASYAAPAETFWANGACMMIRARTVREVGEFDGNMRFICSDADFSFTARARGWKVFVVPTALCQHSLGASGGPANMAIETVKLRDVVYFAEKWLTGGLYRRLACEGPQLTPIAVRKILRAYEAKLREIAPQEQPAQAQFLFSWLQQFRLPQRTGPF